MNLSYEITGSITKCHNGILSLKLVHLWIFNDFLPFFIFSFLVDPGNDLTPMKNWGGGHQISSRDL